MFMRRRVGKACVGRQVTLVLWRRVIHNRDKKEC